MGKPELKEIPVDREIEVDLVPAEKFDRAQKLVEAMDVVTKLDLEFSRVKEQHKGLVKAQEEIIGNCARAISTGRERRLVQCNEVYDYVEATVTTYRRDTGEEIDTRKMTLKERQLSMPDSQ